MDKIRKLRTKKAFMILSIILGSFIVAFGNTVFLEPLDINAGGLNGIGIIVKYFFDSQQAKDIAYNIVIYVLSIGLWFIGFFFISKDFAFKTLISSLAFPVATTMFTMVPGPKDFAEGITNILVNYGNSPATIGTYMLFALVGGVIVGFGVAITFLGGGSTGGVDVLTFIFEKYLGIKQSVASFLIDGLVVGLGMAILCPIDAECFLLPCLVGILSIAISALMIDIVYIAFQTVYQVDIISSEWKNISSYTQDTIGRGATIVPIKGGYKEEDKIMLRVVLSKLEYEELREFISKVDSNAFITITQTKAVFGEGFKANKY